MTGRGRQTDPASPPAAARRPGAMRVLVADADRTSGGRLEQTLADAAIRVVAVVADASGAVAAAVRHRPHACLVDVDLPGGGIRAAAEIKARQPDTKVVMMAREAVEEQFFAALRAGASGYLLRGFDPGRLPQALQDVVAGEAALPRRLVTHLMEEFRERGGRRRHVLGAGEGPELTSREWEVLELMRRGLPTGAIASRLSVSPGTVRSHIAAIRRKLGVADRDAVLRVVAERQ